MSQDISVTDLFCGAGGSSIGAEAAGARLVMAANHWKLAIETHNTNFPNANHDCADVSQVNPRRYPRTDILIASPECTNHSSAKSNKIVPTIWDPNPEGLAEAERSRATMWDVPRFAEQHRYAAIVVENVVEARNWVMYDAWLAAMHALGYEHRAVYMNSMTAHPTPQSRDRMYVVFWRPGNTTPDLRFDVPAFCPSCETDVAAVQSWKSPTRQFGKYRTQYLYRCPICAHQAIPYAYPAASAIDWSIEAPRIGDRARPLAPATLARIRAGLEKYGPAALVQAAGHTFERPGYHRAWPITIPIPAQTATAQHAIVIDTAYAHRGGRGNPTHVSEVMNTFTTAYTRGLLVDLAHAASASKVRSTDEPAATQTGQARQGLVVPLRTHGKAQPASEAPFPTFVAGNAGHALLIKGYTGGAEMVKQVTEPTGTITTQDHHGLLQIPFTVPYYGNATPNPVSQALPTVTSHDRHALVDPAIEIDDCGFRMLEPHEIGAAMAFPSDYVVLGTKRDRVRQYGNAVTPPVMSKILQRVIDSLKPAEEVA